MKKSTLVHMMIWLAVGTVAVFAATKVVMAQIPPANPLVGPPPPPPVITPVRPPMISPVLP